MRVVRGGEDTYLEVKVKLSNREKIAQEIVALANTGGGVIVFGVNDQLRVEGVDDPESVQEELVRICREDIQPRIVPFVDRIAFDNGRRIVALEVEGKRRPYRTIDGRFFLRIGAEKREASREELADLLDDARPLGYENVPVIGATIADIDEAHLWSYVREFAGDAFEEPSRADYPTGEVLKRDLTLAAGSMGEVIPTVAGLLLFGRDRQVAKLLPRSAVTVTRFGGDTTQSPIIESAQLEGNLNTLFETSIRFIERYCDLWESKPREFAGTNNATESPVASRPNFHRDVVVEGVANALVHRDLVMRDIPTRIYVFDRSIEIINPRRTEGFMPAGQRAIRYGVPMRLSPQIAAIFSNRAYGLKLAPGGLPMLLQQSRLFAGKRADVHALNDEFRLRLHAV